MENSLRSRPTTAQTMAWTNCFEDKTRNKLAEDLSDVTSSSKLPRIPEPSDKVKPAYSPSGEKAGKAKPSSPPDEEGKSNSKTRRNFGENG